MEYAFQYCKLNIDYHLFLCFIVSLLILFFSINRTERQLFFYEMIVYSLLTKSLREQKIGR